MIFRVPSYYDKFRCIADKCQDSCCIGWEIDIDEDTADYYRSVEGSFGKRLKEHMVTDEDESLVDGEDFEEPVTHFTLRENGWCPFLNEHKLCDICMELGEEALSEVCTEFPRFTMEYENVREKVLSLSCEEVGRLVFSNPEKITWNEREVCEDFAEIHDEEALDETADTDEEAIELDGKATDYDEEEDEIWAEAFELEQIRAEATAILQNRSKPVFVRAAEYLCYCERMQRALDAPGRSGQLAVDSVADDRALLETGSAPEERELLEVDSEADEGVLLEAGSVSGASEAQAYEDFLARLDSYDKLEVLDGTWEQVKRDLRDTFTAENYLASRRAFLENQREREYEYEHLLVYFTHRYFMRAYYDANIRQKAQFAVASVLVIRDMDVMRYLKNQGTFTLVDRIINAKIYSKEVEHSEENLELLAEEFQFEEVFSVKALLDQIGNGVLLKGM